MEKFEIIAFLPGIFYRKPSPEEKPFAEIGDKVEAGSTIGLIEVMKQFNEIAIEQSGTIVEFLIEDGDAVEVAQVIAILER